jgi:translation initiation factor 4E
VSATAGPGEQLTVERVEKLAQETAGLDKHPKKAKGFKNIPTLDAITARYARTRTLSVDGTAVPPEAEPIEDPQTPGLMTKPPEHPLQHSWYVPVRLGWEELPISPQSYRATFPFTHGIMLSFLYT